MPPARTGYDRWRRAPLAAERWPLDALGVEVVVLPYTGLRPGRFGFVGLVIMNSVTAADNCTRILLLLVLFLC